MTKIPVTSPFRYRHLFCVCSFLAFSVCASAQSSSQAEVSPHFQSAEALEHKGDVDGAIAEYRLAIKDTQNHSDSHYNLGRLLETAKHDHKGAISEYREALRIRPNDSDAHNNLGLALKGKGDLDGATREYREAIRLSPAHADAHVNLGNIFYSKKDSNAAMAEYRTAIHADPTNAGAHSSMANALDDNGQTDAGIAEYKEALRLQPDNANTHYNLAISFAKKRDGQSTLAELREAARLAPDWPTPHLQLLTLLRQDDPRGALEECKIADGLTRDPKVHEVCEKLASVLQTTSPRPDEPSDESQARSSALFGKGSGFFLQKDYRNAAIYYQQAVDLEKQKPQLPSDQWHVLVDNLAMAYGISGDLKKSQETLEYGISKDSKYPDFYYTLACAYAEGNDLDHTLSNLKLAFEYRKNLIPGEHMPDPRTENSFQRFKDDARFQKLVALLTLD